MSWRSKSGAGRQKSSCSKKVSYSRKRATAARQKLAQSGIDMEPYFCPVCKNWHLTTKTAFNRKKERG